MKADDFLCILSKERDGTLRKSRGGVSAVTSNLTRLRVDVGPVVEEDEGSFQTSRPTREVQRGSCQLHVSRLQECRRIVVCTVAVANETHPSSKQRSDLRPVLCSGSLISFSDWNCPCTKIPRSASASTSTVLLAQDTKNKSLLLHPACPLKHTTTKLRCSYQHGCGTALCFYRQGSLCTWVDVEESSWDAKNQPWNARVQNEIQPKKG